MRKFINKIQRYLKYRRLRKLWLGSHGDLVEYEISTLQGFIQPRQSPSNLRRWGRVIRKDQREFAKLLKSHSDL